MILMEYFRRCTAFFLLLCVVFLALGMSNEQQEHAVTVGIDPRIELLYVIDAVAKADSYHNCRPLNTVYHQYAMKFFDAHRHHEAIVFYRERVWAGHSFAMLEKNFLTLPISLAEEEFSAVNIENEDMRKFLSLALVFYKETRFNWFLEDMNFVINEIVRSFNTIIQRQAWHNNFFQLFSESLNTVDILLSPLKRETPESYVFCENDKNNLVMVFGLLDIRNGFLVFAEDEGYQSLLIADSGSKLIRYEMEQHPEALFLLEQHLSPFEEIFASMGFDNAGSFVAYQAGQVIYWKLMDEFHEEYTVPEKVAKALEEGFFMIEAIEQMIDEKFFHEESSLCWKTYALEFMDRLVQPLNDTEESICASYLGKASYV